MDKIINIFGILFSIVFCIMVAIAYISEKIDKKFDLEQRRYEIAKDVLSSLEVHSESTIESDCKLAIEIADELIKQLKLIQK